MPQETWLIFPPLKMITGTLDGTNNRPTIGIQDRILTSPFGHQHINIHKRGEKLERNLEAGFLSEEEMERQEFNILFNLYCVCQKDSEKSC